MNKKLRECSTLEIKNAMANLHNVAIIKKEHLIEYVDESTGELKWANTYDLKQALKDDNATEWRLLDAKHQRNKRLYRRVANIVKTNRALFITLTFNNEFFSRDLNDESIARIVKRYLKANCKQYVANIDFGGNKGRLHYHAIVEPLEDKLNLKQWRDMTNNSNINVKHIITNDLSVIRTAKYINKLTNHSLKDNGYYKRLIFSRA